MDAQNILEPIKRLPIEQRGAGYAAAQEKLIPDLVEANVDVEKQKAARDIGVREAASKEAQRQTGLQEEEYAKGRETLAKYELPTFKPTKEDLSSYAQLGSMIGTLGLMLGNSGKSSSRMAINSMSGMLNGWRQGRKDLYEKESKAFDQEFKRIGAIRKDIQNDIENAMKMWATKRKDAVALAETAAYKAGTDSVLGTMIRQGRLKEVRDLLESNRKVDEKALETKARLDARKEEMAQRERQHRETMQQRADLAKFKKGFKGEEEKEKTTADIRNKFESTRDGLNAMTNVLEKLDNPVIKKNWEKGSIVLRRYLSEKPSAGSEDTLFNRFIKQESIQSLPPEIRDLMVTIASARNDYYKLQSGTAVSGNEATRNFGATIQPSDNLDSLKIKASQVAKKYAGRINDYVDSYQFAPGLVRSAESEISRASKYYEQKLPKGIPEGSRKVGKSESGTDVYEAPDGSLHTPD